MHNALIGIITRNDPNNFSNLVTALQTTCSDVIVINDGQPYPIALYQGHQVVRNPKVKHNSACVNMVFRKAIEEGYEHVFILADNLIVKDANILYQYIDTANETGVGILNFALSAVPTVKGELQNNCRAVINYTPTIGLTLNHDSCNSLSYVHTKVIDKIGYMDERYKSILDWADYCYRGVEAGVATPWGWFADVIDSNKSLGLATSTDDTPGLRSRIMHAAGLFKHKFQLLPEHIPQLPLESVKSELKIIKGKNILQEAVSSISV